jgi:glycosyltransferase involved in cell wall biosynthesis
MNTIKTKTQAVQKSGRSSSIKPLLTVFIPTYNRGPRVVPLINYILPTVDSFGGLVEIFVSNNVSTDGTGKKLEAIISPNLRVYEREVHLRTAEENIFHSISGCRGEYVWILGDDDIPNLDTFRQAVEVVRSKQYDFIFYNSMFIDANGGVTGGQLARINTDLLEVDFTAGACAVGLTSNFAGLSNVMFRKEDVLKVDFEEVLRNTNVYSHVAWWLIAFQGGKMAVINQPLVMYRVDEDEKIFKHFQKLAKRTNVGDYYFWSIGLVRLLTYLENQGALTAEDIRNNWEFRREGGAYRLIDNISHLIHQQIRTGALLQERRNKMSNAQLDECLNWLLRIDPGFFECAERIRDIYAARDSVEIERLSAEFEILRNHKILTGNRYLGQIGRYEGYAIYKHLRGFVAFSDTMPIDYQDFLRTLDPRPMGEDILTHETLPELREIIRGHAERKSRRTRRLSPHAEGMHRAASAVERLASNADLMNAQIARIEHRSFAEIGQGLEIYRQASLLWRLPARLYARLTRR